MLQNVLLIKKKGGAGKLILYRECSGEILRSYETRVTASLDFEVVNIDRQLPERQPRVFAVIL